MGRFLRISLAAALAAAALSTLPASAGAVTGNQKWVIVLCKFTDRTTEPNPPSYFAELFSDAGSAKLGMLNYWKDISNNNLTVSGTVVNGWNTIPMTRYQWAGLSRYNKIRTCADTATGITWSDYWGVVAIFNDDSAPQVATTTVPAATSNSQTSINVASSAGFPAPPFAAVINDGTTDNAEKVNVTAVSGTTWTIARAYEGSTARAHAAGAAVALVDGGDLGASGLGQIGVSLDGATRNLGMVVLPPQTNGVATAHEQGHGLGFDHSRALSTSTTDYQDCYDIMSGDACRNYTSSIYTFQGDFGAAGVLGDVTPAASGPGANAINLHRMNWMPAGRTFTYDNSTCGQATRTMAALNYPSVGGDMNIRMANVQTFATPNNMTTTTDYLSIEYRDKSLWDRGIPRNAVLLHLHGADGFSYWIDTAGTQGAMLAGATYVDAARNTYVAVNQIDAAAHTAQLTIAGCKINAAATWVGATSGQYSDQVTLAADLVVAGTTAPVPNAPMTLSVGSQSCNATTNAGGRATCTVTLTQTPGSVTASATFAGSAAYNSATSPGRSFAIEKEDTALTYTGDLTGDYNDPFSASATLVDADSSAAIQGATVSFALAGTDTCSATTDSSGSAGCSITTSQPQGTYPVTSSFAGDAFYRPSGDADDFLVTPQETTTTYTGPTVILQGSPTTLTGVLLEEGVVPIAGRTLTLSVGGESCTGTTDASGVASCSVTPAGSLGSQPLVASFAGDPYYEPSSDTGKTAIVFRFPSRGAFTLGDVSVASATPATTLTWWDDAWSSVNSLSGGPAPTSFKGFADDIGTPPPTCGMTWRSLPGNSPPPTADIPAYMGTLVTSRVRKTGKELSGTTPKIVVVTPDAGYAPDPGHPGRGRVVATYCG